MFVPILKRARGRTWNWPFLEIVTLSAVSLWKVLKIENRHCILGVRVLTVLGQQIELLHP